eukprot:gene4083-5111_t
MNQKYLIGGLIGLLVIVFCFGYNDAKYVAGHIKSDKSWVFLSKFCYSTEGDGYGFIYFTGEAKDNNTRVFIYDDQDDSFPKVYGKSYSCDQKTNHSFVNRMFEIYNFTNPWSEPNTQYIKDKQRPHFWYVVAANCNGTIDINYKLTMKNQGGLWKAQFSYDEQGLEALYLVYFWVFLILVGISVYNAWSLIKTRSFHPIVKILMIAVLLEFFSCFILLIHYGIYSHDGVGAKGLRGFGELLDLGAQIALILLLIFISKGWAISRVTIDEKKIIFGVVGGLSILYLIMFIWYQAGLDPASSVYMYDTVPGILLLIARSLAMIWFMWCAYNTYMEEQHPAKRQFFLYFGVSFVFWFLSLPLISIIAAGVEPWVRQKTVLAIYVTFNALALYIISFLLSPSRASDFFTISGRVDNAGTQSYEQF